MKTLITFLTSKKMISKYINELKQMCTKRHHPMEKKLHKIYEKEKMQHYHQQKRNKKRNHQTYTTASNTCFKAPNTCFINQNHSQKNKLKNLINTITVSQFICSL